MVAVVNNNKRRTSFSRFLCCGMSRLFKRKQGRFKRVKQGNESEMSGCDNTVTPTTHGDVTQPAIRVPGDRQLFSLEDLADNSSSRDTSRDTSRDQMFQELAGRQANCENLVRELAGSQAVLHERVGRLERKLGKQGMQYKRLADLVRNDSRRLHKQIAELHNKV